MKEIERSGKTLEEAIQLAVDALGVSKDNVQIEVIEEPGKGILNIFNPKLAKVKVRINDCLDSGMNQQVKEFLRGFLEKIGLQCELVIANRGKYMWVTMNGEGLGLMIGKHGQTLNALQYITNMVANKNLLEKQRIILDINSYRIQREEILTQLAKRIARKVKDAGKAIELEPMNPHERRIIHMALQGEKDIMTYSQGEEPDRSVVVALRPFARKGVGIEGRKPPRLTTRYNRNV